LYALKAFHFIAPDLFCRQAVGCTPICVRDMDPNWFSVMKEAQERPFWTADPHRPGQRPGHDRDRNRPI
jgi:hypothetical protein